MNSKTDFRHNTTKKQEDSSTDRAISSNETKDPEPNIDIIKKGKKEWEKTVDSIGDIITILDLDMRIIRANRTAYQEFCNEHGELIGMKCHMAFHNSEEPCENCPITKTIEDAEVRQSLLYLEYSGKTFNITGTPLFDDENRLNMVVHVARDVTNSLRQEEEHKRLSTAIKQVSDIIVMTDKTGTIKYTNPAFTEATGYTKEEAMGRNMNILKSNEHGETFYRRLWEHLLEGKVWKGKFINKKKDNSLYPEQATISPIIDAAGKITAFVAVKQDVSDEEALQKRLQQAIKLEAIGTLAGGIAHDFNNILSSMIGYAQIAKGHTENNPKAQHALHNIVAAGDKAADLIKQILTFSRQDHLSEPLKPLRIQYILKEALKLTRSSLPATIKINQYIDSSCSPVMADAGEIHQAIMNLIANAKQAIGANYGEITVRLLQRDNGKVVCLKITDTGCGMDEQKQKRIFDPFFTTKPKDHGTGLGLSVVHGIIKKHNATIDIDSQMDKGTTFTILFAAIPPTTKKNTEETKAAGGDERILIIDDEPQLVDFLVFALKRLGYKSTPFCNSIEAVRYFRENSDAFDLVITDMTMPNMTGAELAREILSLRPDMPIILTTGYSEYINPEKAERIGIREFMTKPLKKDDLARTIRKVLDNG